jgi:hypothetical protein
MRNKKIYLIVLSILAATVILTTHANAANATWICTINSVSTYGSGVYINLTEINGEFTNWAFSPYTGQENRQLAIALTALTNDYMVTIVADYKLSQSSRKLIYLGLIAP